MFKYIKISDCLRKVIDRKIQLKDTIYKQQNNKNENLGNAKIDPRVAYSNISLIINNISKFNEAFQKLSSAMKKKKQPMVNNKYLFFVMMAEYLNVGQIKGGGKIKKIIMENLSILPEVNVESKVNKQVVNIRLRKCCQRSQSQKWEGLLSQYKPNQIIPNLFDINHLQYSKLVTLQPTLRTTPACVIQSFSSNLPPFLLFKSINLQKYPKAKFDVIDACSAPGNKTIQLAQYLGDRGVVWAFQKDIRRYKTLTDNIEKYQVKNIKAELKDFLLLSPEPFRNVKLILLDPSCSGSGMLTNFTRDKLKQIQDENTLDFEEYVDKVYEQLPKEEKKRIEQLKKFQLQLLSHSAKFRPFLISYSTCSIYKQQNQQVVEQFLADNPQYCVKLLKDMKLTSPLQKGLGIKKKFKKCLRVDPRQKISDGFFVCVFKRKKQNENCSNCK